MPRSFFPAGPAGTAVAAAAPPARRRRALMGSGTVARLAGLYTPAPLPRVPLSAAACGFLPFASGRDGWEAPTPPLSPAGDTAAAIISAVSATNADADIDEADKPMLDAVPSPLAPLQLQLNPSNESSTWLPPPLGRLPQASPSPEWRPSRGSPTWGAAPLTAVISPGPSPSRGRNPSRVAVLSAGNGTPSSAAGAAAVASVPTPRRQWAHPKPLGGRATIRIIGGDGSGRSGRGVDKVRSTGGDGSGDSRRAERPAQTFPTHPAGADAGAAVPPTPSLSLPPSLPARRGARGGSQSPLPYTLIEETAASTSSPSPSWYPLSAAGGDTGAPGRPSSASPTPWARHPPTGRPGPRRLFRCTYPGCASVARFRSNAKTHARLHTTETPFVCGVAGCGRRFKWASSMSYHRKQHAKGMAAAAEATAASAAAATASVATAAGGGEEGVRGKNAWGDRPM